MAKLDTPLGINFISLTRFFFGYRSLIRRGEKTTTTTKTVIENKRQKKKKRKQRNKIHVGKHNSFT